MSTQDKIESHPQKKVIGLKFDGDKPKWELLPLDAVEEIVKVMTMGARKYAPNNWQHVDDGENRYTAAMFRHMTAISKGEVIDQESGLPHISHVACNALFLTWFELHKNDIDRVKEEK